MESKFLIRISGKTLKSDIVASREISEERPGGARIFTDSSGKRHRVYSKKIGLVTMIHAGGKSLHGEILEENFGANATGQSDIGLHFTAQFPGKVKKIVIEKGARVSADEPIIVLEAMKMEFTIKAPCAGVVEHFHFQVGSQIQPGDLLVKFAPT